jgi:ABC-type multidrug transport system ATPase subunit
MLVERNKNFCSPPTEQCRVPLLVCLPQHQVKSRPMESWLIGGAHDCDLIIDRATVSAHHCRLTKLSDGFFLEDLQSTNGTFVNGRRISGKVRVSQADRITLGTSIRLPWPASSTCVQEQVISIGGAVDNDIVLDYPMISAYHARLTLGQRGNAIEDLNSTNGTHIGSTNNRITSAPLNDNDVVFFGSHKVSAGDLLDKAGKRAVGSHSQFKVVGESMLLGRGPDCDLVLDYPMISFHHARISRIGEDSITEPLRLLEDLGSTNGTFVNGKRITERVTLQLGDVISLGSYSLTVTRDGILEKRDNRGRFTVEARHVAVDVPNLRLIDDVSLTIHPSEFVGLMGPSGSGKSTLMNALNGYTRPTEGLVFINGLDLYANYDLFRGQIGYVPQDDIIHPDLTVKQALYYTARLRLPPDSTLPEIENRIESVIEQLGLQGTEHVRIGSPVRKGISGGQRKRVNLAMELLTDPSILFLDEPTSGLSSEDALLVMQLLRKLAESGKTILLTIHQPSQQAYKTLDNLVLIAKDPGSDAPGKIAYYGPAYPDAFEFLDPPDDSQPSRSRDFMPEILLGRLAQQPARTWVGRYLKSDIKRRYVDQRASKDSPLNNNVLVSRQTPTGGVLQWWWLVERAATIKCKDSWNTTLLMVQAPIIGSLVAVVFGTKAADGENWPDSMQNTAISTFLVVLAAIWFGCSNSAREIIGEWANYRRERMVNLKIASYVASKLTIFGLLCLIQCAVLLTIVRIGCGFQSSWIGNFLLVFLCSMVGVGIGLVISAVARSTEFAIGLLPIMIIPMVILGGILQRVPEMNPVPHGLCQLMPSRWGFEALLVLEANNRDHGSLPSSSSVTDQHHTEEQSDMAERYFPIDSDREGTPAAALALVFMLVLLTGLVAWILRFRDIH